MEQLPSIITAIGTIVLGWFTYNQYTKNKKTDLEIERIKRVEKDKDKVRNDTISIIYRAMWKLLYELKADRVYIVQPHPLINNMFISITFESRRKNDTSKVSEYISNKPISDISVFASDLAQRDFLYYKNIEKNVRDKRAKEILTISGDKAVIIKRLSNTEYDWVGSIFCEYLTNNIPPPDYAKKLMSEAANDIQYIIPEVK